MIVTLEGIDGSGKGTQLEMVANFLKDREYKVATMGFPTYGNGIFAKEVSLYLNGEYGLLNSIPPKLIALLYAGNRLEHIKRIEQLDKDNDFLLIDRYTYSNAAHQGAKIEDDLEFMDFVSWLEGVEFDAYSLPKPALNILLNIDSKLSSDNVLQKPKRSYTGLSHDIHESNEEYMYRVSRRYLQISEARENWKTIQCSSDSIMRNKNEICLDIVASVLAK